LTKIINELIMLY